jgi:hypothetical protein
LAVDVVELATESNEGFFSRKRMSEGPANCWSRRFPSLTAQQSNSRIPISKTWLDKEVTPAKRRAKPIQTAKDVRFPIELTVAFRKVSAPHPHNDLPRRIPCARTAALFYFAKILQSLQNGLTRRGRAKRGVRRRLGNNVRTRRKLSHSSW